MTWFRMVTVGACFLWFFGLMPTAYPAQEAPYSIDAPRKVETSLSSLPEKYEGIAVGQTGEVYNLWLCNSVYLVKAATKLFAIDNAKGGEFVNEWTVPLFETRPTHSKVVIWSDPETGAVYWLLHYEPPIPARLRLFEHGHCARFLMAMTVKIVKIVEARQDPPPGSLLPPYSLTLVQYNVAGSPVRYFGFTIMANPVYKSQ